MINLKMLLKTKSEEKSLGQVVWPLLQITGQAEAWILTCHVLYVLSYVYSFEKAQIENFLFRRVSALT